MRKITTKMRTQDESFDDQELNSEQTEESEPEIAAAEADDELPAEEE